MEEKINWDISSISSFSDFFLFLLFLFLHLSLVIVVVFVVVVVVVSVVHCSSSKQKLCVFHS